MKKGLKYNFLKNQMHYSTQTPNKNLNKYNKSLNQYNKKIMQFHNSNLNQ